MLNIEYIITTGIWLWKSRIVIKYYIHVLALAIQQISKAKLEQIDAKLEKRDGKLEGDSNLAFAYEGAGALEADFCLPMQGMRRAKPCPLFRNTCGAHEPERCMVSLWVEAAQRPSKSFLQLGEWHDEYGNKLQQMYDQKVWDCRNRKAFVTTGKNLVEPSIRQ